MRVRVVVLFVLGLATTGAAPAEAPACRPLPQSTKIDVAFEGASLSDIAEVVMQAMCVDIVMARPSSVRVDVAPRTLAAGELLGLLRELAARQGLKLARLTDTRYRVE